MNRRKFMQGALALGIMQALPFSAVAKTSAFDKALGSKPWLLGWQSVDSDNLAPLSMQVAGKVPAQLQGTLFRNGPAKHQRGDVRYQHWFDGDGMVQKFSLSERSISHQGQFIQTEKYKLEQAAGKFLYNGAGTNIENPLPQRNNDSANTANTALLPWDNELLALWEGGSAYRLDPKDLSTLGVKTWRDDLQSMPFSAHPLVDNDGTLWNFGLAPYAGPTGMLFIYQISPKTGLQKVQPVTLPMAGFMHDFAMTEHHLVFYLPPYVYQRESGKSYVERFQWQPQKGGRILLVDKNDLTKQRWFDAPAGFIFHFGNAYENRNQLCVNACWYADPGIMNQAMHSVMNTEKDSDYSHSYASQINIDLASGKVALTQSQVSLEFPGFDERFADGPTAIFGAGNSSNSLGGNLDQIVRFDYKTDKLEQFNFASGIIAEEPLFVPRHSQPKAGAGWLINTFLDFNKRQTGITIFDAEHLSDGPLVVATMERHLPLGFHGCFV